MTRYLFTLLILVVAIACNSSDHSQETAKIDAELKKVEQSKVAFLAIDSTKAKALHEGYSYILSNFKEFYHPDTVDQKIAMYMNKIRPLKSSDGYSMQRKRILEETNYTISQLKSLKKNINDGTIPVDSIEAYLILELKGGSDLRLRMDTYSKYLEDQIINTDTVYPFLKNYVDSLRLRGEID